MEHPSAKRRTMTYRQACNRIGKHTRKGDTLLDTFKAICDNRYCHPVRDWAIYDLFKLKNKNRKECEMIDEDSVIRLYNMHLSRLWEIFVSS